ncbi:Uncharacterised protein [Serratia entomophila]|nr:Uncharacterised protein [Serratia entomophila]CAI1539560.1 Uncharacterised protein [Serratia entomophila]CAI1548617.1 Uncharacterised protein [Serratia entomophila]CAI1636473.1 Uncharacterised protein [Serratia entomophila]CAI1661300.1 Uncharacterised protein [Serratia entomophila]
MDGTTWWIVLCLLGFFTGLCRIAWIMLKIIND